MSSLNTNWSRNELRAYLLLYCANANFVKTKEETEQIKSKIDKTLYKKLVKSLKETMIIRVFKRSNRPLNGLDITK